MYIGDRGLQNPNRNVSHSQQEIKGMCEDKLNRKDDLQYLSKLGNGELHFFYLRLFFVRPRRSFCPSHTSIQNDEILIDHDFMGFKQGFTSGLIHKTL